MYSVSCACGEVYIRKTDRHVSIRSRTRLKKHKNDSNNINNHRPEQQVYKPQLDEHISSFRPFEQVSDMPFETSSHPIRLRDEHPDRKQIIDGCHESLQTTTLFYI